MAQIRLKTKTPTEVRRTLSRIMNMVVNGELDTKTAILSAIRKDEQEKQIEELAELLEELTNAKIK